MTEWLFDPIFKTQTCVGVDEMVCHTEPGLSPIVIVIIGAFLGLVAISTLINSRKDKKMEKEDGVL